MEDATFVGPATAVEEAVAVAVAVRTACPNLVRTACPNFLQTAGEAVPEAAEVDRDSPPEGEGLV